MRMSTKIAIILAAIVALGIMYIIWYVGTLPVHASDIKQYYCFGEPTSTPEPTDTPYPSETPVPSEQPLSTPEPQNQGFSATSGVTEQKGPDCQPIEFTPTILGFKRVSPTSIHISWSATDPIKNYVVFYGPTKSDLVWNTGVLKDTHDVTLNSLPVNQMLWVQVFPTDGVCLGTGSQVVDP